jgi:plasmid stability protein
LAILARIPCYTDPVANLTLTIDDDTLRAARIRALEQGTSVNAVVREYLEQYAYRESAREAVEAFLRRAERSHASSGPGGRSWTREELYDRWDRRPRG